MRGIVYVIEYESASTVNDEAVGTVYAEHLPLSLTGRSDCWSYDRNPWRATHFACEQDAEEERRLHSWPASRVVALRLKDRP